MHNKVDGVIKLNMVIAIPCAVGLAVLARPIVTILFPSLVTYRAVACRLLVFGSSAVVFYAMSTITTAVLQGSNRMGRPVIHCTISLLLHIAIVYGLLKWTGLGVYALIIGNITFPLLVCILNMREVAKVLSYQWKLRQMLWKPFVASLVMGCAAFVTYQGIYLLTGKMLPAFCAAMVVAMLVYAKMLMLASCFTDEELKEIPFGDKIDKIRKR